MEIVLIRHGQTASNHTGRHQGWSDNGLSDAGRQQAERTSAFLKDVEFDAVWSSDLRRASETAGLVFGDGTHDINHDERLREINIGQLTGVYMKEAELEYGDSYVRSRASFDYAQFDGESSGEFVARTGRFIESISRSGLRRVAAVTHGGAISAILSNVIGLPVFKFFTFDNCSLTTIYGAGNGWRISRVNCTDHLRC